MKNIIVIPARYASSRFPGKMLAPLAGKVLIQHVYEKAVRSKADMVMVATDHKLIFDAVTSFGGKAVMTAENHPSGTDRIAEAVKGLDFDTVINLQGDEPLIPVSVIDELIGMMNSDNSVDMATVAVPGNREALSDPNKVKVVFGSDRTALYFSRSVIPFLREGGSDPGVYLHWGIYAYRKAALERFITLPPGRLENCEKLEQLRALENGIKIKMLLSNLETIGVDTPEDLAEAEKKLSGVNNG